MKASACGLVRLEVKQQDSFGELVLAYDPFPFSIASSDSFRSHESLASICKGLLSKVSSNRLANLFLRRSERYSAESERGLSQHSYYDYVGHGPHAYQLAVIAP